MSQNHISYPELWCSREKIVKDFYSAFDPSLVWREWSRTGELPARTLSGEGRHFESYRLARSHGIDMALNIAKPGFMNSFPERKAWIQRVKRMRNVNHPLLPPTEILEGENDQLICIQPYCETPLSLAELARPQLKILLEELSAKLQAHALQLDDYWQLRSCRGHPFIIDLSELKESKVREFSLRDRT